MTYFADNISLSYYYLTFSMLQSYQLLDYHTYLQNLSLLINKSLNSICFTVYSLYCTEYLFTNTTNQKLLTNAILQLVTLW